MFPRVWLVIVLLLVSTVPLRAAPDAMVDPAIDGLTGPFSYLARSSTVLGGIGASGATQVTWDGAFYTGHFELCLVTGDPPQPVAVRPKQLSLGYLPIVHYAWQEGEVRYSVSAFAATIAEDAEPVSFIRLQARRMGEGTEPALVGVGVRHSGLDRRASALEATPFTPSSKYEFIQGCAAIDDHAVCVLPTEPPAKTYATVAKPYEGPFTGADMGVGPQTATLIALWQLEQGEELSVDLKMPWKPLPLQPRTPIEALRRADFDEFRERVVAAWQMKLGPRMNVKLPEEKPVAACRANIIYALVSVEEPAGKQPYVVNRLARRRLYPGESAAVIQALDLWGHHEPARACLESLLSLQQEDGCLSLGGEVVEHCAVLEALTSHIALTGDRDWASAAWPRLVEAADWLVAAVPGDRPGDSVPRLAALAAVRDAAYRLGHDDQGRALGDVWRAAAMAAQVASAPLGADAVAGALSLRRAGAGPAVQEALPAWPEQMTSLCRQLREQCAEGLIETEGLLDPVATAKLARLHAMRGEQEQAVRDLYSLLVHTGCCHEGFASGVRAWSDRDSGESYPPDPLFSAAYTTLLRDLLVCEEGAQLHLFSGVSPEWLQDGEPIVVENAPTFFGPVTAVMAVKEGGAEVLISAEWHAPPERIVLHLPYPVEATQVGADRPGLKRVKGPAPRAYATTDFPAAGATGLNEWLELPPDTTRVEIEWTRRSLEPLSYQAMLDEWQARYRDRYDQYIGSGKAPLSIEPPPLN